MTITEILDKIQRDTNTQNTTTSSYPTTAKTVDINLALNQYFILANSAAGNWRPADDTNQSDYPIILGNLVSGQQDYSFVTDANGNQVLDISKVRILNPDGITWTTLSQINQDIITDGDLQTITSGIPTEYFLTANGVFLVQKPNYNMRLVQEGAAGLEIWINRSPVYFTSGDVSTGTKKAGLPWAHHEYLSLRPSYFYCLAKGLPQTASLAEALFGRITRSGRVGGMESAIKKYWRDRNKDFSTHITAETINSI